jgi:DNA-binding MarR family transcriptional regulator
MNYQLVKDLIDLAEEFERFNSESGNYSTDIKGFKKWVIDIYKDERSQNEPGWEGKLLGRSPESIISSLIVHMNRFGKSYFKSAIHGSEFSTQDDVIYLIVLKFSPKISKMDLIKKNVHEKPAGMQIINRLMANEWIEQTDSEIDKRSKLISITKKGLQALDRVMKKIRQATDIVAGDLMYEEKMELIRLLNKLNDFHQPIYDKNIDSEHLLNEVLKDLK